MIDLSPQCLVAAMYSEEEVPVVVSDQIITVCVNLGCTGRLSCFQQQTIFLLDALFGEPHGCNIPIKYMYM